MNHPGGGGGRGNTRGEAAIDRPNKEKRRKASSCSNPAKPKGRPEKLRLGTMSPPKVHQVTKCVSTVREMNRARGILPNFYDRKQKVITMMITSVIIPMQKM